MTQDECFREVVLMAPLPSKMRRVFALYKRVDPIDARGAIAEWARRSPTFTTDADVQVHRKPLYGSSKAHSIALLMKQL